MRRFHCILLVSILLALWCTPVSAAAILRNGELVYREDGRETVFPASALWTGTVEGSSLIFVGLDSGQARRIESPSVLFFFDERGSEVVRVESTAQFDAERCSAVSASPDGSILAFDSGTWLIRNWIFMSLPKLTPVGQQIAFISGEDAPSLIWAGDRAILVTSLDTGTADARDCSYDPCGSKSVVLHSIEGKSETLFQGSALCDYTLSSLKDGVVFATESCAREAGDWADLEMLMQRLKKQIVSTPLPFL